MVKIIEIILYLLSFLVFKGLSNIYHKFLPKNNTIREHFKGIDLKCGRTIYSFSDLLSISTASLFIFEKSSKRYTLNDCVSV